MRGYGSIFFPLAALVGLGLSAAPPGGAAALPRKPVRLPEFGAPGKRYESAATIIRRRLNKSLASNRILFDVAGWTTDTGNASGITPFVWRINPGAEANPLGISGTFVFAPGPTLSRGEVISANNNGMVTGTVFGSQGPQVFRWDQANGAEILGAGFGLYINNSGKAFGSALQNGRYAAAEWGNAGQPPVIIGPAGVSSQITCGDTYGNSAGVLLNNNGTTSGFKVVNGALKSLPGLGGANVFIYDMNNLGIQVGAASLPNGTSQSVWWDTAGVVHNLNFPGSTTALAVSENGVIVVMGSDGLLHLTARATPDVLGTSLGISPTPEFLNIGGPFHVSFDSLGEVAGVQIDNGNDYHAAVSIPQSTPLAAAAATEVGTILKSVSDLVSKLQQGATPGTPTSAWLSYKISILSDLNDLVTLNPGQSLTPEQSGELINGLSNSLALDTPAGPYGGPALAFVSAQQLQQIKDAETQALKTAGWDPNVIPAF